MRWIRNLEDKIGSWLCQRFNYHTVGEYLEHCHQCKYCGKKYKYYNYNL